MIGEFKSDVSKIIIPKTEMYMHYALCNCQLLILLLIIWKSILNFLICKIVKKHTQKKHFIILKKFQICIVCYINGENMDRLIYYFYRYQKERNNRNLL